MEVEANDLGANLKACEQIYQRHKDKELVFNLTCGSKVMAIAAYEVARRHAGVKAFYLDSANGRIVWLLGEEEASKPFRLSVEEYLTAYGRKPERKPVFEKLTFSREQACRGAAILARGGSAARSLLERIRQKQGSGRRAVDVETPQEHRFVAELANIGVLEEDEDTFWIRSNEDWNFFKGNWLEAYVWSEAVKQKDEQGHSLFDEVEIGLEIPSEAARKEIDVACLYQSQLLLCSCKAGRDPFSTSHLDELSALSNLIGGRFCSRVFITNSTFSELHNSKRQGEFLAQAKQREIVVVAGEELTRIGAILKRQATEPDFRRV